MKKSIKTNKSSPESDCIRKIKEIELSIARLNGAAAFFNASKMRSLSEENARMNAELLLIRHQHEEIAKENSALEPKVRRLETSVRLLNQLVKTLNETKKDKKKKKGKPE